MLNKIDIESKYSWKIIFIFFLLGSIIGTFFEEALNLVIWQHYETRHTVFFGPFNPIYGIGFASIIIFLHKNYQERSWFKTWFYAMVITGNVEFLEHFILEKIFGITFWDYSHYFLNIDGRTTIPFIIGWGIGGIFIIKWLYPLILKLINKIPKLIGNVCYYIIFIFLIIDITITYTALGRMALRHNGEDALTFIGKYCDQVYDDDYIKNKFPAMKIVTK